MSETAYQNAHRDTNKRIVSLGQKLWNERQNLREQEEDSGIVSRLGPDSEGAFVTILLALYKDPNMKGCHTEQSLMRRSAIQVYESAKGAETGSLWCPVSHQYLESQDMKAAHIVPRRLPPSFLDYIFGNGNGSRLHTADNCLIVHQTVERHFDNGDFVIIPADPSEQPIMTWKIQVTKDSAINAGMGTERLGKINGRHLKFMNNKRPAARFLYYHLIMTLLINKRNRQPGWEKYLVELPSKKLFARPGRYLRNSMLLTLAKSAGDLDPGEEARLLGEPGQETFQQEGQLGTEEEDEIARRAFAAREPEEDDEEEDEEYC